ncbi:MAG TPA: HEAT repeat domain-containing protein [Planctomycetota bacterium]|nr:HEAT repeat domain-containing protein [Planctomycetota bacterium]
MKTLSLLGVALALLVSIAASQKPSEQDLAARTAHLDLVSRAAYCATCHPEATAENQQNTHGRAFTDEEARLATARFAIDGCIACHTPRPVFETGIGMNPKKRLSHLEEGDDCLSCHARKGVDFSTFVGGKADCKSAFDERVGTVEACASCHKNHGTPYQWESAEHGKLAGNTCVECHMPKVVRPIAVGGAPVETRRHTFFASRSESQLRKAYSYRSRIEGNEVVVTVENTGAGHNFPTELKQRSVESLVVVRDIDGNEVARSRDIHRDPYKRPYGLMLQVNTQIPSGQSREHRVPITVAAGTIETTLYYKLYYPIEDEHPTMSRRLETRVLPFSGITPSTKPITSAPELDARLPEALPAQAASPGNLADFARPEIGKTNVEIPDGTHEGDIADLIALFQFPVGEANRKAQDVLVSLGAKAVPQLVAALGSWDSKTWTQSKGVLGRMGDVGRKAVVEALSHQELYVRLHAQEALTKFGDLGADRADAIARLKQGLKSEDALARAGSATALGNLKVAEAAELVRPLLDELDWDVCASAAKALAAMGDKPSLPKLRATFERVKPSVETGRDLAWSLAALGDTYGMSFLFDGLAYRDDLVRESFYECFLDLTGVSRGYAPMLPAPERLGALAELRNWWSSEGGAKALRVPRSLQIPGKLRAEVEKLAKEIGGDDMTASTPARNEEIVARFKEIGAPATPMLVDALKWPSGFSDKRAGLLRALAASPDPDALAALIDAARDPVTAVALWAIEGLSALRDPAGIAAAQEFEQRFDGLVATNRVPYGLGSADSVRALVARARARMGDPGGGESLLGLLWSRDASARVTAETTLAEVYGKEDPKEPPVAVDARRMLAELPDARARELQTLQDAWEADVTRAEDLADKAKTTEERLAALAAYDKAEAAAGRYSALDERAWKQDFERTRLGSDAVAELLAKDKAWIDSARWRDALAPGERDGWNLNNVHEGRAHFGPAGLTFELAPDAKVDWSTAASLEFGTREAWRDYEVQIEVTLDSGGIAFVDRCNSSGNGNWGSVLFTPGSAPEGSATSPGLVQPGRSVVLHTRVIGGILERRAERGLEQPASTIEIAPELRVGGLSLSIAAGTKLRITALRVRPLRVDALASAR